MASSKANAKLRLLLRANSSKKSFQKDTIDEEAIHRNRSWSMKLKRTLFVIHFENRKQGFQQEQQSTDQTNSSHYDHIFQWYKFALGTCTQCGPMFSNTVELKSSLQFYNPLSKQFISFSKQLNYFKFLLHFWKQNSQT